MQEHLYTHTPMRARRVQNKPLSLTGTALERKALFEGRRCCLLSSEQPAALSKVSVTFRYITNRFCLNPHGRCSVPAQILISN